MVAEGENIQLEGWKWQAGGLEKEKRADLWVVEKDKEVVAWVCGHPRRARHNSAQKKNRITAATRTQQQTTRQGWNHTESMKSATFCWKGDPTDLLN